MLAEWILTLHLVTGDVIIDKYAIRTQDECEIWALISFVALSEAGKEFKVPTYTCQMK